MRNYKIFLKTDKVSASMFWRLINYSYICGYEKDFSDFIDRCAVPADNGGAEQET